MITKYTGESAIFRNPRREHHRSDRLKKRVALLVRTAPDSILHTSLDSNKILILLQGDPRVSKILNVTEENEHNLTN